MSCTFKETERCGILKFQCFRKVLCHYGWNIQYGACKTPNIPEKRNRLVSVFMPRERRHNKQLRINCSSLTEIDYLISYVKLRKYRYCVRKMKHYIVYLQYFRFCQVQSSAQKRIINGVVHTNSLFNKLSLTSMQKYIH